ncbi:multi-sensor hybrid histidine kinase [mine drainage metagenome]|uniref:Multi-sensor hybrid histidine kinase n=1 Tax=mine drainage metagenome TaxID=410659 RepID=T1DCB0_9ZZZZ
MGERQDVDSIFQVVIRALETQLALDFCSISQYDAGEDHLTVIRVGMDSAPLARELAMTEHATIPIDRNGLSRCVGGELVYEPELAPNAFPFAQRLAGAGRAGGWWRRRCTSRVGCSACCSRHAARRRASAAASASFCAS